MNKILDCVEKESRKDMNNLIRVQSRWAEDLRRIAGDVATSGVSRVGDADIVLAACQTLTNLLTLPSDKAAELLAKRFIDECGVEGYFEFRQELEQSMLKEIVRSERERIAAPLRDLLREEPQ